jgi:DNA polymerase III alpha subunit
MGFKRSEQRMQVIESKLRLGMTQNAIVPDVQDRIVQAITSFALYGFPESHAASFALIAYASAYLKCHHLGEHKKLWGAYATASIGRKFLCHFRKSCSSVPLMTPTRTLRNG